MLFFVYLYSIPVWNGPYGVVRIIITTYNIETLFFRLIKSAFFELFVN